MLIPFFYALRDAKLPVSVKEFLTLLEALKADVVGYGYTPANANQADPGGVAVGIQAGTNISGRNTVSDNKLTAATAGNTAASNLASLVTAGTVNDPVMDVNNAQTNRATLAARVKNEAIGIVAGGNIVDGANSVDRNEQTAQSYGNTAGTNKVNVSADNILGTPAIFGVTNTQDNIQTSPVAVPPASITSEVLAGNIGIRAGSPDGGSINNSVSTVSDNKLTALVGGNTATANSVVLDANNTIDRPAATVTSGQTNGMALVGNVLDSRIGVSAVTDITDSNATVSGNKLLAQGQANMVSSNDIQVSADVISAPVLQVLNTQRNLVTGSVSTDVSRSSIGINVVGTLAAGGVLTGSNSTVSSNNLTATAEANKVLSNAITVTGGNTILNALAVNTAPNYYVKNDQENLASTSARLTGAGVGINAATVASLNATVSDNILVAKAGGNWANSNQISVTAENTIGASSAGATTGPNLFVENIQNNTATPIPGSSPAANSSVNALVDGVNIGVLNTGTFNNVNASVLSNQIVAYGYGNWASNGVTLSQLTGNSSQATAGISNLQMNSQSITSVVMNVNIGLGQGGAGGASGGASVVSGNGVTAQVVGNTAANRILTK